MAERVCEINSAAVAAAAADTAAAAASRSALCFARADKDTG